MQTWVGFGPKCWRREQRRRRLKRRQTAWELRLHGSKRISLKPSLRQRKRKPPTVSCRRNTSSSNRIFKPCKANGTLYDANGTLYDANGTLYDASGTL